MDCRIDAHRYFVGILAGDALVHVEQVAVAFLDDVPAQPLNRIAEIQVYAQPGLPDAAAFVANRFRVARRHIARHQVSETRIPALQVIIASASGICPGGRLSPFFSGTQIRPSLRSDSLISVSFDWYSPHTGMHVGWICVKQGLAKSAPFL